MREQHLSAAVHRSKSSAVSAAVGVRPAAGKMTAGGEPAFQKASHPTPAGGAPNMARQTPPHGIERIVPAPFPVMATPAKPFPKPIVSHRNLVAGIWRLADPKISLASMAGLFLGGCLAAHDGVMAWGWLGLTVAGIFCIEVAKNASGELFDFDSGADLAVGLEDRSPFSGGKRVLVDGLLTRGQTAAVAAVGYGLGLGLGGAIWYWREPAILWLGLGGVALAFFYHAPPFKLSYRGLGELAVAAVYGPGIVAGTYLVQRGAIPPAAWCLGLPLGLLVAAFLWINEFPDYVADRTAGKRNLVVILGRKRASRMFALVVLAAQATVGVLPVVGLPVTVLMGWASVVPAAIAAQILIAYPDYTRRLIPAQALTLIAFLLFSLAAGLGVLLAP